MEEYYGDKKKQIKYLKAEENMDHKHDMIDGQRGRAIRSTGISITIAGTKYMIKEVR